MAEKEFITRAINWARKKGISSIKANIQGFEQPSQFKNLTEEQPFVPDISGIRSGKKFYVEVVSKTEKKERSVSKWKLLSTLAEMKGGKLFLLAPKGNKAFAERMINKYNINNTQLVYLPNT